MAFSKIPTSWIASWAEDGTNITVPIASFPELTAAEADGASGDIREIAWAFTEKLFQEFNSRATEDRPTKMNITKSSSINATTGVVTNNITFTFQTEILTQNVIAEPA